MKKEIVDQLQNDFGAFRWYCNFTLDAVIPAFEEVLKAKDKIAEELKEVEGQYAFISRMEEKIYRAMRKGKTFEEQVQLDLSMEEGRKDVERRYAAARGAVYKKYRFYRMCSGQSLSYKPAKTELGHSMLNGTVTNVKGQLCNVVEEDPTHSGLPKPDWIKNSEFKVHNRVPRGAVKKTITDIKSAITNWRNGNIKSFEFKRRTKRDDRQILHFEDTSIPQYIKNLNMVYRHGRQIIKRNPTLTAGSELVHDKLTNKYYMMVPESYDPAPLTHENQVSLDAKTIVFDEGIRAFLSGYVPNTCTVEFGTDTTNLLQILTETDKIRKRITELKDEEKISKLWTKIKRLNRRLKNKISDMHWKICRFLSLNFKTVIIPTFPVQEIANALGFNHDSKRLLYLFSHYAFKQKLAFKARENGFQTFLVGEAYTSQTCGKCHNRHKTKSKTYICPKCHIEIDRDLNAARNILLKFLYELCRRSHGLVKE
jgi:IS605 OrfB family transposase